MRFALGLSFVMATAGTVSAGAALDESKPAERTTEATAAPDTLATVADKVEYGIDIRLRSVYVPKALLELFVDSAPGGAQNYGFGVDLLRRRGNLELQLGLEFEHVNTAQGVYIENNTDVAMGDEVDYILSPKNSPNSANLGWFTVEFTFLNHAEINKYLSFRYGGGAGLGIVTGKLYHYNVVCSPGSTNSNPGNGCTPPRFGGTGATFDPNGIPADQSYEYDLPPVFPVVNAIIGLQIKPVEKMVINIEGGIRTLPFLGTSVGYFF